MDRLDRVHRASRVELSNFVIGPGQTDVNNAQTRRSTFIVPRYIGIFGFVACGALVIALASFAAISL